MWCEPTSARHLHAWTFERCWGCLHVDAPECLRSTQQLNQPILGEKWPCPTKCPIRGQFDVYTFHGWSDKAIQSSFFFFLNTKLLMFTSFALKPTLFSWTAGCPTGQNGKLPKTKQSGMIPTRWLTLIDHDSRWPGHTWAVFFVKHFDGGRQNVRSDGSLCDWRCVLPPVRRSDLFGRLEAAAPHK